MSIVCSIRGRGSGAEESNGSDFGVGRMVAAKQATSRSGAPKSTRGGEDECLSPLEVEVECQRIAHGGVETAGAVVVFDCGDKFVAKLSG